ncbi:MAG: hypothetical protein E7406_05290 [Ruminococcaceae bacterium]|nr:hypothetical protein [Oscillospiraceae bacterium]
MNICKYIISISTVLVLILAIYLFSHNMNVKMVTNSAEKLKSATIKIYIDPYDYDLPKIIEVNDKSMLDDLYSLIKGTTNVKVNRYPRHSVILGSDPQYEITLFYDNGVEDKFGTPQNSELVYRILESNDDGYVIGQNKKLSEYILYLAETR